MSKSQIDLIIEEVAEKLGGFFSPTKHAGREIIEAVRESLESHLPAGSRYDFGGIEDPIEQQIVLAIVEDAIKAGFALRFDYEEGQFGPDKPSTDVAEVLKCAAACERETLLLYKQGRCKGAIFLVYGNGCDILCDYSDTPAMVEMLERANKVAESFSEN